MKPLKVSELNNYIKTLLERDELLSDITIKGEISGFKPRGFGHSYFILKDSESQINAIVWQGRIDSKLMGKLKDGISIIARGRIGAYSPRGNYSFQINEISFEGEGDLAKKFQELKIKLEKEGLFSSEFKKEIPKFPNTIGIITSAGGAVINEMLTILKERNNLVSVLIFDSAVQGEFASNELISAIENSKNYPEIDLLIIGRGGGGVEDLNAFNDEALARKIFANKIPIISAVGHGADFAISDFVSDKRAETPTDAIYLAIPDLNEIRISLNDLFESISKNIHQKLENLTLRIKSLGIESIKSILNLKRYEIDNIKTNLIAEAKKKYDNYFQKLNLKKTVLESKNPKEILKSGYSYLMDEKGGNINSVLKIKDGDKIKAVLYDGEVNLKAL